MTPPRPAPTPCTGDRAARFRSVFDAHHRELLAYALRRTAAAADAADVLAETMLVAWRRIDDVPPGEAERPWLYGVARKVLANHRRGDERRRRLGATIAAALGDGAVQPIEPLADQLWVRAALASLEEVDREVLTLTTWEGLTPSEVAMVLDLPAATVRTRLHRARGRLRVALGSIRVERSALGGHEQDDGTAPVPDPEEVT